MRARSVIVGAAVGVMAALALQVPVDGAALPSTARSCDRAASRPPSGLAGSYVNQTGKTFRISFSLADVRASCAAVGIRQATAYQELSTGAGFHRNSPIATLKTNARRKISKTVAAPFDCSGSASVTVRPVVQLTWIPKPRFRGARPRSTKTFRGKAERICPPPVTTCETVSAPPPRQSGGYSAPTTKLDPAKTWTATVVTSCGTFAFRLDVQQSPNATASIAYLAGQKFFDGTIFHRIAQDFLIQGGDPTASGTGGPGYSTLDTPPSTATYTKGVVAMAKTGTEAPGTAGSQFFVVTTSDAGLTPDYAIVGRITQGMDVADRIGKLGDASDQPTRTVLINTFQVTGS